MNSHLDPSPELKLSDGWDPSVADRFLQKIEDYHHSGWTIVPLLGSGFSFASGIPTTAGISDYLTHCLLGALGNPDLEDASTRAKLFGNSEDSANAPKFKEFWDPRSEEWPSLNEPALQKAGERLKWVADKLSKSGNEIQYSLLRQVYGCLADWRAALQMLSRLGITWQNSKQVPICVEQDFSVIDRFFNRMTADKRPTSGHRILVALCRRLHINLIITPNFDDLIEIGFSQAGAYLKTFEVHRDASLPPPRVVSAHQRSLVKLHGGQFGLRADFSLDAEPRLEDQERFVEYLSQSPSREPERRTALLVGGLSVNDARMLAFLRKALETKRVDIFWVCHSTKDSIALDERLSEHRDRIHRIIHPYLPLLFGQIYTRCTDSLPPSGMIFPTTWNLPCPAYFPAEKIGEEYSKYLVKIRDKLSDHTHGDGQEVLHLNCSDEGCVGLPTLCAELFRNSTWAPGYEFLWFEFDGISGPASFFVRLLESIAGDQRFRVGPFDLSDFAGDETAWSRFRRQYQDLLLTLLKDSTRKYVVFMCAMNRPGAGVHAPEEAGWNQETTIARFRELLVTLSQSIIPIRWVLVSEWTQDINYAPGSSKQATVTLPCPVVKWSVEGTVRYAHENWAAQLPVRLAFLYILTSFRMVRHPLILQRVFENWLGTHATRTRLVREEDGKSMRQLISGWVSELQSAGVLRIKPGGYIWMNVDVRENLRKRLENNARLWLQAQVTGPGFLRIHALIARAYGRHVLGSADPLAALESIKHVFYGLDEYFALDATTRRSCAGEAAGLLLQGTQVLRVARDSIIRGLGETFIVQAINYHLQEVAKLAGGNAKQPKGSAARSGKKRTLELPQLPQLHSALTEYAGELVSILERAFEVQGGDCEKILSALEKARELLVGTSAPPSGDQMKTFEQLSLKNRLTRAVICLCGRKYAECQSILAELLTQVGFFTALGNGTMNSGNSRLTLLTPSNLESMPESDVLRVALSMREAGRLYGLEFILRLLRRSVYYVMHVAHVRYLLEKRAPLQGSEPSSQEFLHEGRWLCRIGLTVLRLAGSNTDAFVYYENARFRAHAALIEGRLASQRAGQNETREDDSDSRQQRFLEAEQLLTDAEAFLEDFPIQGDRLTRGVVELRRAEVTLQRVAVWSSDFRCQRATYMKSRWSRNYQAGNEPLSQNDVNHIQALLREVDRSMDRVERLLRDYPNSKWWWQIFEILNLKRQEYWIALQLFTPTVVGGSSAAIHHHLTPANLSRFIRDDVFHLARAADSAASIYWLYRVGLPSNDTALDLESARKNLKDINDRLNSALKRIDARKRTPSYKSDDNTAKHKVAWEKLCECTNGVSPDVMDYGKHVSEDCTKGLTLTDTGIA